MFYLFQRFKSTCIDQMAVHYHEFVNFVFFRGERLGLVQHVTFTDRIIEQGHFNANITRLTINSDDISRSETECIVTYCATAVVRKGLAIFV